MTKKEFLKQEVLKKIAHELSGHGFKLNKSSGEFTKNIVGGWQKYQIVFLDRKELWELNPCMLIRKDIVEDIFHRTSGFELKYQKGTPTIGISVEDYLKKKDKYRFLLSEESQIDEIADSLINIFLEISIPFFNRYNSLEVIESAINKNPDNISLTGSIFRGVKGIILAKLLNNKNYNELSIIYTKYYEDLSDGFYLPGYNNLLNFIETEVN